MSDFPQYRLRSSSHMPAKRYQKLFDWLRRRAKLILWHIDIKLCVSLSHTDHTHHPFSNSTNYWLKVMSNLIILHNHTLVSENDSITVALASYQEFIEYLSWHNADCDHNEDLHHQNVNVCVRTECGVISAHVNHTSLACFTSLSSSLTSLSLPTLLRNVCVCVCVSLSLRTRFRPQKHKAPLYNKIKDYNKIIVRSDYGLSC